MGTFSIWHGFIVVFYFVLILVPAATVLRKAGRSGWWALVFIVPVVNVVALWIFAFSRWPALGAAARA
ncbi:MAG: hypothetical protein AB7N54_03440 [Alphaproteobacteria bacterium]